MLSCSRHSMKIFSLSSLCNSRRNNILRVWNIAMVYLSRDCHFASSHANAKKLRYIWGHFPCFLLWSLSSIERLQIIDKEKEHAVDPCQYQSIGNAWSILFWLPHSDKEKGAPLLHHSFLKGLSDGNWDLSHSWSNRFSLSSTSSKFPSPCTI